MKVIIAGGRDTIFSQKDYDNLATIEGLITEVVSGMARGVDRFGYQWAEERGIPVKAFFAQWKVHGKAAGFVRNKLMADYADGLAVFRGGNGTEHMIKTARKRGLQIWDFRENDPFNDLGVD